MGFLTTEPIRLQDLLEAVASPDQGGVATFLGTVRDHHGGRRVVELEYSSYPAMVEAECARIVGETEARWPCRVALRHRLGRLAIGDVAVAVVAAAAHRGDALEACRSVIEEVKRRAPIWKRERYSDGTEAWVDPTAPEGVAPAGPPAMAE